MRRAASRALAVVAAAVAVGTALVYGQVSGAGLIERVTLRAGWRAQPFDPDALAACVAAGPGYSMAFDATTRTKSTPDTVAFLQRHLHP